MPAVQQLLFPDPRPLVERLGVEFFRSLPAAPGVYLMRDNDAQVLYIGKAKNLRQRLVAYRVANPVRMRRRHLRLLRATVRIDIELCEDERAALAREAELLLALRPKFNRAGVWPAPERYLLWLIEDDRLEVTIGEETLSGWSGIGPLGSVRTRRLRTALVRLLWLSGSPQDGLAGMPWGWAHGRFGEKVVLPLPGGGRIDHCLREFRRREPRAAMRLFAGTTEGRGAAARGGDDRGGSGGVGARTEFATQRGSDRNAHVMPPHCDRIAVGQESQCRRDGRDGSTVF